MKVLQAILGTIFLISLQMHAGAGAESSSSAGRPVVDNPDSVPDDKTLEAGGALIGAVEIRTYDIFNTEIPGEGRIGEMLCEAFGSIPQVGGSIELHDLIFQVVQGNSQLMQKTRIRKNPDAAKVSSGRIPSS